jgi:Domain of unknown function (DUF1707)
MGEAVGRDGMRAGDADRRRVADQLRTALEEGRLDLHEYDERLQLAYAAKTYGDLDALLTDLPAAAAPPVPAGPAAVPARGATREWLVHVWQSWVSTALMLTVIWAISGLGDFWPVWVIGPWGVILLWRTIGGLVSGAPRRMVEERAAEELAERAAKERKRERKALEADRIASGIPPATGKNHQKSDSSAVDTPEHG